MPQTNTTTDDADFQEALNMIMATIEPDLCTYNLQLLEEKYKDETNEQRALRLQKYNNALTECQRELENIMSQWVDEYQQFATHITKNMETESDKVEADALATLESYFLE